MSGSTLAQFVGIKYCWRDGVLASVSGPGFRPVAFQGLYELLGLMRGRVPGQHRAGVAGDENPGAPSSINRRGNSARGNEAHESLSTGPNLFPGGRFRTE